MSVRQRREVFDPVLFTPITPSVITPEQEEYIKEVLRVSTSDSRFAEKAWIAISKILAVGSTVTPPVVSSLDPETVEIGSPSFDLHVHGSNFIDSSVIIFAGHEEPTSNISDTELSTGIDMSVWQGADTILVSVATDGVAGNSLDFVFTAPVENPTGPGSGPDAGNHGNHEELLGEQIGEQIGEHEQYIDDPQTETEKNPFVGN